MTNTVIYNAVALGTTTEKYNASPTKTVMAAGTTGVILSVQIVAGQSNNASGQSQEVELCYAISPFTLTADATLNANLKPGVGKLRIKVGSGLGEVTGDTTGLIANNGGNLYTWFNSPALAQQGTGTPTITLRSLELP